MVIICVSKYNNITIKKLYTNASGQWSTLMFNKHNNRFKSHDIKNSTNAVVQILLLSKCSDQFDNF